MKRMRMAVARLLMLQQQLLLPHGARLGTRTPTPPAPSATTARRLSAGARRGCSMTTQPQRRHSRPSVRPKLRPAGLDQGRDWRRLQSTDGTEASHMHTRGDPDRHRGYEWWLLEEARAPNPGVVGYAPSGRCLSGSAMTRTTAKTTSSTT